MNSFFLLFFLKLAATSRPIILPPTGRWNYLGQACSVEFALLPSSKLLLLEVEARSASVSRFILNTDTEPIPSVIRFKDQEADSNKPIFPLAATIMRPIVDATFKIEIDDQLAPIFVRVTDIQITVPGDDWSRRVRNMILIRTKIPHFLQESVCSYFGALPAIVKCRNYNEVIEFVTYSAGEGASISIGEIDKNRRKENKIVLIDTRTAVREVKVRAFKSRGPITKRKMILCESFAPDLPRKFTDSSDSECPVISIEKLDRYSDGSEK